MRIKFLLWILFVVLVLKTNAQEKLPPVYELKTDTLKEILLDSTYWQKLEDKEGKWTFGDVRKEPLSARFHIQTGDTAGIHTYWQRYRLKNTMNRDAKISLTSQVDYTVDYFDVYVIKQDSSVTHYKSGFLRKWEERDGLKSVNYTGAIPLVLAPGEEITVYDRWNQKRGEITGTSVQILSTEKLLQDLVIEYTDHRSYIFDRDNLLEEFTAGMLFISILISLFFFRATKEKVYIYFTLFALFLAINRQFRPFLIYTIWFRQDWYEHVPKLGLAWDVIPFFLIQFIRHFYGVKKRYPKWDKLLFGAGFFILLTSSVSDIVSFISGKWNDSSWQENVFRLSFLAFSLLVITTALLYIRHHNRSFRIMSYGVLPFILLYLVSTFFLQQALIPIEAGALTDFVNNNFRLLETICLFWLIACFVWVLIMRFDALRRENAQQALDKERLAKEKETERAQLIEQQNTELEKKVEERTAALKSSQAQLIQSEKMASLGELTAGIAHEIQNPLNFVNNFSEVSNELIDELNTERSKPNTERNEQTENDILNDIKQNLEKINHHGKRADGIVKGMLQHSRSSSGQKEVTDINALCDEYLRLAYHGLRVKDKSFNAKFETEFDHTLPKVNVAPQEMGRVILNLINNAFYAVNERKKLNEPGYEPTVIVSTRKEKDKVEIRVKDNGTGIPKNIVDKIFQPFFTTKPTGSGTGLGLSLAYDIVKAHGGEIKVDSKEGEGTGFVIQIPFV